MKKFGIILILLSISFLASSQTKTEAKCSLWKPKTFCDISDTLNVPSALQCIHCTWSTLKCEKIEKKGNFIGVHIRFSSKTDSTFSLESKFKNITLIKKVGEKKIHPYAILWYGQEFDKDEHMIWYLGYMIKKFRAKEYIVKFKPNKPYDLIFLFRKAAQGDKIVIDNFIETEIKN